MKAERELEPLEYFSLIPSIHMAIVGQYVLQFKSEYGYAPRRNQGSFFETQT